MSETETKSYFHNPFEETTCKKCGHRFDSLKPTCPKCHEQSDNPRANPLNEVTFTNPFIEIILFLVGWQGIKVFVEIIKNIINVLYIGRDSKGLHFSIKDSLSLNLEENGEVIINGAQGITGTPKNSNFTIGVILIILTLLIVLNLIHSRDGRAIMSIRDNLIAAESVGIHITKYKLMAFTISAALAGPAGVLYSHNLNSLMATPKNFGYNMSIMILVFVVLGGIGNIRGSVIAAVILTLLPELLRGLNDYRMLIYSIVLIVMMLYNWAPNMIAFRKKLANRFSKKKEVA